jgi:type II secretory pathway pseudopilin PulG
MVVTTVLVEVTVVVAVAAVVMVVMVLVWVTGVAASEQADDTMLAGYLVRTCG